MNTDTFPVLASHGLGLGLALAGAAQFNCIKTSPKSITSSKQHTTKAVLTFVNPPVLLELPPSVSQYLSTY